MIEVVRPPDQMKAEIEALYARMTDLGLADLARRASESLLANVAIASGLSRSEEGEGSLDVNITKIFEGHRQTLAGIIASYEKNDSEKCE